MPKQIRLNAFDMNCVGHQSPGLWTHPDDRADSYNTLEYWTDLARLLERGKFDALFLADVLGIYDVYKDSPRTALEQAVQVPVNDPMMLVSAMALVTEHLGFGVTCALSYELPYPFARRMSTLDHLTKGRIGWNIVTGYLESAARGMGLERQVAHDGRYDVAEDYMQAAYKLWEASWEDGAVLRDRKGRRFADADKIHRVRHEGPHFKVDAIHLSEPSPQRTPVLFQAGASTRGRDFAARHAECVFINGPSKKVIGGIAADLRRRAAAAGRDPSDLVIFTMMTVITDRTSRAAQDKYRDYLGHVSEEGALALMSGWTGLDFGAMRPDEVVRFTDKADAMTSALEAFTTADPDRTWTVGEIARHAAIGGRGPMLVGSGAEVADALLSWVADTGVDGFNLAYVLTPGSFADVVDLVVPELQARGVYKRDYAPGTLRQKLFGRGPRLPASHPAAAVRPGA
ncbi:LLM class flavin-dependent oxidoreductase [Rhodopila globiformis]|uniref:5,10-methylene tetrahydromethanopterin reductase n=1 Tax=Rhodopila globiformis TaxID=1071 RepID=A0A2S6N6C8_RHOGL|nr:LLM class flavin-dependent oxidoreductase [Rhodopila globiformis]PPQ30169.1 5,10-methylene tetrahydromethanopterin reductase [Rhodopila globiformis]